MAACRTCGASIGFEDHAGKWRPVNGDGTPHRCRDTRGQASAEISYVKPSGPHEQIITVTGVASETAYNSPEPVRTDLQELRHAIQRLSRAVELLSEQVNEAVLREMAR